MQFAKKHFCLNYVRALLPMCAFCYVRFLHMSILLHKLKVMGKN